ncbi:MAG: ABC transporter ATP-binding protein [Actinobacteria bacterium]|nr:MAG: ABC transporter ATP-binding protein [Actinomycetota bacterium]
MKKNQSSKIVIEIKDLWESFRIYHHKSMTLKDTFVRLKKSAYEEFWALKGVSFKVFKGETLGIIGENGSGKSTLLKCISGILEPSKGCIKVKGKISPLLELGAGFHPELSGRENIFINGAILGLTKKQIQERYDKIVAFAELEDFIDTQVKFYSSGMYIRLGFAVAIFADPDILMVDEVLAVGDESFRKKCFDKIKEFQKMNKTIIIVTHDMGSAYRFCDRLVLLSKGKINKEGKPKEIVRNYVNSVIEDEKFSEKGSKDIVLTKVELFDENETKQTNFSPGDNLVISITYNAKTAIKNPIFGFAIFDQQGNHCFGTHTKYKGLNIPEVNGVGLIRFKLDSLPMLNGKFYLTVAAINESNDIYHELKNCLSFEVTSSNDDEGTLYIPVECEIQSLSNKSNTKQEVGKN